MKLIIDTITAEVIAEPPELQVVKDVMTVEDKHDPLGYTCFVDSDNTMLTGLVPVLTQQLPPDMPCELHDRRQVPPSLTDIAFAPDYLDGTPESPYRQVTYQEGIARKALHAGRGIIHVGTGGGKTEIAALMIKWLMNHLGASGRTLFIVGDKYGLQQTAERFRMRGLGLIGRIGDGEFTYSEQITVAIVDSVHSRLKKRDRDMYDFLQNQDLLVFDEVQHLAANSWFAIGVTCPASFRYGLSGMPFEHPKYLSPRDMFLMGLTGPVVAALSSKWLRDRGYLAEPIVTWYNLRNAPQIDSYAWQEVYRDGIVDCVSYNSLLISIATTLYDRSFKTLLFVAYKKHGFQILAALRELGYDKAVFCHGNNRAWYYNDGELVEEVWEADKVFEFVQSSDRVLLVGSPFIDEGADLPSLNALILGGGMKKYGRIIQRIGRGLRPKADDNRVFVFDVQTDYHPFLAKHARERAFIYEEEAFTVISPGELPALLGFKIPVNFDLKYGEGNG